MNTKKEYQKPQTEVIDLQLEAPIANSTQSSLNYNSGTGRSSEEAVNNFWSKGNFIDE